MALKTNSQLEKLRLSGIRRFSALAARTPGCVSLTLGEPGEDTPAPVRAEVARDLDRGLTHYPPNNGYPWLREAIARRERARGVPADVADSEGVIVTCGATEALAVALTVVLEPGDEVVIPTPAFSLYESLTTLVRGVPVALDTAPAGFQVSREALEAKVTGRTKAIVLCSPNNPTGCVLDAASLDAVACAAAEHDLFVICDDVYESLVYASSYQRFSARHPELSDRVLVAGSFSKPWAMTGWRLGWLLARPELAAQASKVHQYLVSSVPAFVQHAALRALEWDVRPMRDSYRERRDLTVAALEGMGLPLVEPEGAFYAFPSVSALGLGSEEFCERAILEAGVALVPGVFFGAEGYVRLSFACDRETLEEGLARLAGFVGALRAEGGERR
ncbi:MAG: aminotransferase class I/II-fold pyridoxal phosphate-dependent enzyme [Atopobiaceae bacterium]|nr:aminotransferase class I/II-fold pyridoxal phosphate-dependent enzyme [Olsenella sp.]MDY3901673.1 aminotransferase class I/II-fold pyridoxal phosphate-dependent enzyme [Atopobiaceae bacterium]